MIDHPLTSASTELLRDYQQTRKQTERICIPLETEDYTVQPITDVSPPKWHLGHTTWFFENFVLIPQLDQYQPFNLELNYFFNSYYESQGPRILRSNRGNMTRPSVEEVLAYRAHVDQHMQMFMEGQQQLSDDLHHLITVGLQHEQQHQELLITDIKYILGDNPLHPAYREQDTELPKAPESHFLSFAEGLYEVGYKGTDFCWDNEQNSHKVYLNNFAVQSRLVTNGEYLAFMQDGGYDKPEYWLMEGFEWTKPLASKSPQYWYEQDGQWYYYTMQGLRPLDLDAPVTHVSYYEADAYAQWCGLRLPTEFEWEAACQELYRGIPADGNFQESGLFMPTPARNEKDYQFLGQVWEWTASAYLPYPGYPRFKGALGEYNGKFMVNQMVLRGGSCATPIAHIRPTYRNFFHADKRWQFTGIRLVK